MDQSTQTKHRATSNTQENVQETNKENYSLIDRTRLEGTPFTLVELKDKKQVFLTLGDYRLTENLENNPDNIEEYLQMNQWTIIMQLIAIAIKRNNEQPLDL